MLATNIREILDKAVLDRIVRALIGFLLEFTFNLRLDLGFPLAMLNFSRR